MKKTENNKTRVSEGMKTTTPNKGFDLPFLNLYGFLLHIKISQDEKSGPKSPSGQGLPNHFSSMTYIESDNKT